MKRFAVLPFLALAALAAGCGPSPSEPTAAAAPEPVPPFDIMEAQIADIHAAIKAKSLTTTQLVEQYLERIKAYNGTCVNQPDGVLGLSPITHRITKPAALAPPTHSMDSAMPS